MQAATAKAPALSAVGEARGASNQRGVELGKTSIATTGGGGGGGGDGADKKKGAGLAVVVEEDLRPAWCLLPALRGFLKVQGLPEAKRTVSMGTFTDLLCTFSRVHGAVLAKLQYSEGGGVVPSTSPPTCRERRGLVLQRRWRRWRTRAHGFPATPTPMPTTHCRNTA